MPESILALAYFGAHTQDADGNLVSIIAGGYRITSTEETTTFTSKEGESIAFPRDMLELLVNMLESHIPSGEDNDYENEDFTDQEAEERLP